MRYLFAAVIAVFVVTADFESSHNQSIWTEPSFTVAFTVALAQSEHAVVNTDSDIRTASASIEPSPGSDTPDIEAVRNEMPSEAAADAAALIGEPASPICEAVKNAAEESDIPIGFLARLLWQESRFRAQEVSSAGARGIAQFMPQTAVEVGLKNPFDPFQAIPASAKFLRKLRDQFGNLGLAAAAYNAGGGRIEKWLSRRSSLPKETRAYVQIITGHKAEAWTAVENTVYMPTDLPQEAPCEGVGGLSKSRQDQVAEMPVSLTPSVSEMLRKAEADGAEEKKDDAVKKLRLVAAQTPATGRAGVASRKIKARAVLLAGRALKRRLGKQTVVRLASTAGAVSRARASRAREL